MTEAHEPGTLLQGRYRITGVVGEGATGIVYMAEDLTVSGARWAIKEIKEQALAPEEQQEARELFARECRILSTLNHTGVPKLIDSFTAGSRHYMVMEFIEGESLDVKARNHQGPFKPPEILPWMFQVLDILEYLHRQAPPVIFRDLKPSNIVITAGGKAKLIDFGIARVFQPGRHRDTQIIGTPGFSAPEQYGTSQTDERSDLYSLGATMYFLLSGKDPEHFHFTFPPLSSCNGSVPPWLSSIIAQALEREPGKRFQSAAAMKNAMHDAMENAGERAFTGNRLPPLPQPAHMPWWTPLADMLNEPWRTWGYCMVLILCSFVPCVGGFISIPGYLGLALLALASLVTIPVRLVQKDMRRALTSLGVMAASCAILAIPLLLFSGSFTSTRARRILDGCSGNLKNIATSLELYATDNKGLFPTSLSKLAPGYLKEIPACPGAHRDTYSPGYVLSTSVQEYTVCCRGSHHGKVLARPDYPQYSSVKGLVLDPGDL